MENPAGQPLPAVVTESAANLVTAAMQQSPDLKAIAEKLNAATAAAKEARSEYLPTVRLAASGIPAPNSIVAHTSSAPSRSGP